MFSRFYSFALAMCLSFPLYASSQAATTVEQRLLVRIDALLKHGLSADETGHVVQVAKLLTPPRQLQAICHDPVLSLAGNDARLSGKRSVIATCGSKRHFLQIHIIAHGTWWITKHHLAAGSTLQPEDIETRSGNLEHQPVGIVFDSSRVVGQIATRRVPAGKPLLYGQFRPRWQLQAGQTVEMITEGMGFRIRSEGKALGNAAVGDVIRVQTRAGQKVSGKVLNSGQVLIFLQQ